MSAQHYKESVGIKAVKLMDLCVALFLFICSKQLVYLGGFTSIGAYPVFEFSILHLLTMFVLFNVWTRIFIYMGMYEFRRIEAWPRRISRYFVAATFGCIAVLFGTALVGITDLRGFMPIVYWGSMSIFVLYRTLLFLYVVLLRQRRRNIRKAIIVGLNERALALSRTLSRPELGYDVIGFVDDHSPYHAKLDTKGIPLVSDLTGFSEYVSVNPVDEVFLALPIRSCYDIIHHIIDICIVQGIRTKMVTDLFDLSSEMRRILDDELFVSFISYNVNTRPRMVSDIQRIFDIILSTVAIIVLSPLFLIITLVIYIDDRRPILFVQERVGLNKRRFKMFKFRTMVREAENLQAQLEDLNESDGATFKLTEDPRVTRSGRFLRKTSLDELPQLVNVLLGNMTIVGPRPLPIRDFMLFYDDTHRRRFSVKPGITGLWQVSGRSDLSFEEWMRLDLEYVDNWDILMDFSIIIKTFKVVATGEGAK